MKNKVEWFSVFRRVVPADYEQWLEGLALEGYNLDRVSQFSSIAMRFTKTQPRRYRYVMDLNAFPTEDYKNTYKQFGWEFVGQMSSCFLWRKEYEGERPESFTDSESIRKRNLRVKNAVAVCFSLFLIGILALIVGMVVSVSRGIAENVLEFSLSALLLLVFECYLWWVMYSIKKNIDR